MNEFRDTTARDYDFGRMMDYDLYALADHTQRQIKYDYSMTGWEEFGTALVDISVALRNPNFVVGALDALVAAGEGMINISIADYESGLIAENMDSIRGEVEWELDRRLDGGGPGVAGSEIYKNFDGIRDQSIHYTGETVDQFYRRGLPPEIHTTAPQTPGIVGLGVKPDLALPQLDTPLIISQPAPLELLVGGYPPDVFSPGTAPAGLYSSPTSLSPPAQDALPDIKTSFGAAPTRVPPAPLVAPAIGLLPTNVTAPPLPYLSYGYHYQNLSGLSSAYAYPDLPFSMGELVNSTAIRWNNVTPPGPRISEASIVNYLNQYSSSSTPYSFSNVNTLGGIAGLLIDGGNAIGRGLGSVFDPVASWLDNALGFKSGYRTGRDSPTTRYSHDSDDRDGDGYNDETGLNDFGGTREGSIASGGLYPILLDLDGTGVGITEFSNSTVFMDATGDGLLNRTAWAAAGTGVLFFDADGDGTISKNREYIFTEWDPTATSDMEALRSVFDTNGDRVAWAEAA